METMEILLKNTVEELDRLLSAKNVLGDPIEKDGATVIPIVSYGFGFGFGSGGSPGDKAGNGAGGGAGGGIRPLGAIIIDSKGARVEAIQGAVNTLAQTIGETVGQVLEKTTARKGSGQ